MHSALTVSQKLFASNRWVEICHDTKDLLDRIEEVQIEVSEPWQDMETSPSALKFGVWKHESMKCT